MRHFGELHLWGEKDMKIGLRWEGVGLVQDEARKLGRRQSVDGLCRCCQGAIDVF